MEELTNIQRAFIKEMYEHAAHHLFVENKSKSETRTSLMEQGLDEESADVVIEHLLTQAKDEKKEGANKDLIYGALWLFGGLIVTAVTYSAASGGGTYIVTWGAIIYGAILLVKGMVNSGS